LHLTATTCCIDSKVGPALGKPSFLTVIFFLFFFLSFSSPSSDQAEIKHQPELNFWNPELLNPSLWKASPYHVALRKFGTISPLCCCHHYHWLQTCWSQLTKQTNYPSLLHTHHLLTKLLYQLYTNPTPCNPWHKHPTLQQPKYTQTHTSATKPKSPCISSHTHPPHFLSLLLVPPYPTPPNSIASITNINTPTPTVYRYYHQRGFSIPYINYWSGIEPVNLLLLNYTSKPGTETAHQPSLQPRQPQNKN
jgi:hypothetical protein